MKTFKELSETAPNNNLLLVDGFNLAFRWLHTGKTKFIDEYIDTVRSLAKSYDTGKIIIAADSGSSAYRKAIYPEYKANRKEKFENQTEAEAKKFQDFLEEYNRTLDEMRDRGIAVFQFTKTEADDIAAYITRQKELYNIEDIWLISTDKDWDLLIKNGVSRFSYVTRKETTVYNWEERYDCILEDYISIKCLQGDTGDNIKGAVGIGPKRALELVQKYGSALDIATELPIDSKYQYIKNLNNFGADNIMLNYKLMDLLTYCEEALGPENIKTINTILGEIFNESSN